MMSRTQKVRRNISAVATITAVAALAATIFAPAGFGRGLSSAALWEEGPVIKYVPAVVNPGQDLYCAVALEAQPESADPLGADVVAAEGAPKNVTIYSDPPGAVSYSGTVTGSNVVIPAHVAADAAPGVVTIFIQTDNSSPATATTTVTGR
jgi:hypothetical protein